ncbi:hypothetical protein [Arthrobacter sp. G119Y2]|uniref:hypothetical protein n=1 Tax=Arthrobacter sp. G119Y2 TaxID=3134965 RepID=UPI00311A899C
MSNALRLENPSKDTYVLRNISGHDLVNVVVDGSRVGVNTKNLPAGMNLAEGEAVEFHMYHGGGASLPKDLYIRWDGAPDWDVVPV